MNQTTILITGAGGTVGRLLIDHYVKDPTIRIKALERSEVAMADLLNAHGNTTQIEPILADLLDVSSFRESLAGCDIVIHCAALKHVVIGRHFPGRQAYENITSFYNLVNAARESGVKKFLFCSTDKAAQPTGVMGSAKHLLEFVCRDSATETFSTGTIRFANIIGSSGSLLKVIENLSASKNDFTLRDTRMTRYFLRPQEVLELADYALSHMKNGEIFIFDTPSALIKDVAEIAFEHYGLSHKQLKIATTPTHENIHERLISADERQRTVRNGKFFIIDGSEGKQLTEDEYRRASSSSSNNLQKDAIRDLIYG